MTNKNYKPKKIVDGYQSKKQLFGGFKVVEYYHYTNEPSVRKRVLFKDLSMTDAENVVYNLESKMKP